MINSISLKRRHPLIQRDNPCRFRMFASLLNYIQKYFPRAPQAAGGPSLPTHERPSSWSSSTTLAPSGMCFHPQEFKGRRIKRLFFFPVQAPNDASFIPRVTLSAPSSNSPRRGDIILSVLNPRAWIPIAVMLTIAGLTVAVVRAFGRANDPKKDH
jgi:hypothetical protein